MQAPDRSRRRSWATDIVGGLMAGVALACILAVMVAMTVRLVAEVLP